MLRTCSTVPGTSAARAPTVTRLPYSTWVLLTEIWSWPIVNHVDRSPSALVTWGALRRTTAPDARWKTTESARRLPSRCTLTDSTALPRPNRSASRVEEKLYGPQLWCGE